MRCGRSATTIRRLAATLALAAPAWGQLDLGPEELVQDGGLDLQVPPYSVPSFVPWDGDDRPDLVVGEGTTWGKVRVYPNVGTAAAPSFAGFTYAQSNGTDLTVPGGG